MFHGGDLKRAVESPLKTDRRNRLSAERPAANRAGVCAGQDFQIIGEFLQPLDTREELARAGLRLAGQFGSADVADHQRVPGQQKPRVGSAGLVRDQQGNVLRRVPRSMQHPGLYVAEIQQVSIA